MKKSFGFFAASWSFFLVLFNAVVFVSKTRTQINAEVTLSSPSFWIGYSLVTVAFIGQLICSIFAFKQTEKNKEFYNISLITTSYCGLIISFITGVAFIYLYFLPYYISAIICLTVLIINVIAVLASSATAEIISNLDEDIKKKTDFFRSIISASNNLMNIVNDTELHEICKNVYEAVRYSDPVSSQELYDIEINIYDEFLRFDSFVREEQTDEAKQSSKMLLTMIADRNAKCKYLK